MKNENSSSSSPAMNTASPTDARLACRGCHSTKHPNADHCPECGGTEFKPWGEMVAGFGKVAAPVGQGSAQPDAEKFLAAQPAAQGGSGKT